MRPPFMPIPAFDENGNLPPGVHDATLEQVLERFGAGSPERETEGNELVKFIEWARQGEILRVLINSSFLTEILCPNDVDIVLLPGSNEPPAPGLLLDDELIWQFLDIHVATDEEDFERWVFEDFGVDRLLRPKGIVEVIL